MMSLPHAAETRHTCFPFASEQSARSPRSGSRRGRGSPVERSGEGWFVVLILGYVVLTFPVFQRELRSAPAS